MKGDKTHKMTQRDSMRGRRRNGEKGTERLPQSQLEVKPATSPFLKNLNVSTWIETLKIWAPQLGLWYVPFLRH